MKKNNEFCDGLVHKPFEYKKFPFKFKLVNAQFSSKKTYHIIIKKKIGSDFNLSIDAVEFGKLRVSNVYFYHLNKIKECYVHKTRRMY